MLISMGGLLLLNRDRSSGLGEVAVEMGEEEGEKTALGIQDKIFNFTKRIPS